MQAPSEQPGSQPLLREIREFISELRDRLPEIFAPAPPVRAAASGSRERAVEILQERTRHWSQAMGVTYRGLRVKDQRSLWGSCSRGGNLNFNWRLVLAPPEVMDYVVIHELAHRLEMNHSRRFWEHVAAWCPEYRERRRWLRSHLITPVGLSVAPGSRAEPEGAMADQEVRSAMA